MGFREPGGDSSKRIPETGFHEPGSDVREPVNFCRVFAQQRGLSPHGLHKFGLEGSGSIR